MAYRLRCNANFPRHTRNAEYATDEFNAAYPMSESDYKPSFLGHAVELTAAIGVKFLVDIPKGMDTSDVYMNFKVSDGRNFNVYMEDVHATGYSNSNSYWFVCELNALEIADTITATLHYGSGEKITNKFSAEQYFSMLAANEGAYGANIVAIAKSIHDYGYYLQNSTWTDGRTHTALDTPYATLSDADIALASSGVSGYQATKDYEYTGFENVKFALSLGSLTSMDGYFKLDERYAHSVVTEGAEEVELGGETWYRVTGGSVSIMALDHTFTVGCKNELDGVAIVHASPLAYINAALVNDSFSQEKKFALVSLYNYYAAAYEYYMLLTNTPGSQAA